MMMFRLKSLVTTGVMLATAVSLGACKSSGTNFLHWHKKRNGAQLCEDYSPYLTARSVPVVRVGDGLTPPNTRNAVKVPDGATETHERTEKEGCLDRPPPFDSGTKAKPSAPVKPTHDGPGN